MTDEDRLLLQDLQGARRLLEPENAWVKGVMALDCRFQSVRPEDPEACAFCLSGAILAAIGEAKDAMRRYARVCDALLRKAYRKRLPPLDVPPDTRLQHLLNPLSAWNDRERRRRKDVLGLLDRTIEAESARIGKERL